MGSALLQDARRASAYAVGLLLAIGLNPIRSERATAQTLPFSSRHGLNTQPTPAQAPATSATGAVVLIPLRGSVGLNDVNEPFIAADPFLKVFQKARSIKPAAIVLDIDGPGGRVDEMKRIVGILLEAQVQGERVVAWPRNAGSADAIITLACREIYTRTLSKVGAAVCIVWDAAKGEFVACEAKAESDPAVRAKFDSWDNADFKLICEVTGRSRAIDRAMRELEAELWWSPTSGVAEQRSTDGDWECLDSNRTILTLSDSEMRQIGMSLGTANSIEELRQALGQSALAPIPVSAPLVDLSKDFDRAKQPLIREAQRAHAEAKQTIGQLERLAKSYGELDRMLVEAFNACVLYDRAIDTNQRTLHGGMMRRNFEACVRKAQSIVESAARSKLPDAEDRQRIAQRAIAVRDTLQALDRVVRSGAQVTSADYKQTIQAAQEALQAR